MAKYLDDNGLLYFWQKIKAVFATQADLNDLSGRVDDIVSEGGEPNVIDTVKVNGSALTPDANKAVNITVAQGSANGTIAVNGADVSVKGLGSAAYTNSNAYDASGAAAAVLGASTDAATANTVYGAKAAAAAAQSDVDALEGLVGATAVSTQITNAINGLDSSISAETNKAIASVTVTNGKITGSTKITVPTNTNQLTNGAGYQTASDVATAISGKQDTLTFDTAPTEDSTNPVTSGGVYTALAGKVNTETGKGLSENDFTDALLTKLNGIETGATKITVDSALSSTSTNPLQNKAINTALGNKANLASPTFTGTPTAPTAAAGTKTTQIATTAFVDTAVTNAIGSITGISFEIVTSLPSTGAAGTIYLISNSGSGSNIYDEYIYVSNRFEKIGTTDVDLSSYWNTSNLVAITNAEIDTIVAA